MNILKAKLPTPPSPKVEQPPRLSAHAASVAQHVEALEIDLAAARHSLQDEENARRIAEGMVDELRRENIHLLNERDKTQRQYIELHTRLQACAEVLVKCLDINPAPKAQLSKVEAAVEEALREKSDGEDHE